MRRREDYVQKLKAQIDQWNALIDEVQAKMKQADADARLRHEKQLAEFREKKGQVEHRLKELQASGDKAWDDIKEGLMGAWDALADALSEAKSEFQKGYREGSRKDAP